MRLYKSISTKPESRIFILAVGKGLRWRHTPLTPYTPRYYVKSKPQDATPDILYRITLHNKTAAAPKNWYYFVKSEFSEINKCFKKLRKALILLGFSLICDFMPLGVYSVFVSCPSVIDIFWCPEIANKSGNTSTAAASWCSCIGVFSLYL